MGWLSDFAESWWDSIGNSLEGVYTQWQYQMSPQQRDFERTDLEAYYVNRETWETGLTDQQKEIFNQELVGMGGSGEGIQSFIDWQNIPDHLRSGDPWADNSRRDDVREYNRNFDKAWNETVRILEAKGMYEKQLKRLGRPEKITTKDKEPEDVLAIGGKNVSTATGAYSKRSGESLKIKGGLGY